MRSGFCGPSYSSLQNGPPWYHSAIGSGCKLGLRSQRLVAKILALALRAIAVAERRLVVPPPARIVRDAEEDLVADVRVFEPDAHELHQVLGLEPDRQSAPVGRNVGQVADPDAGDAQTVLERVERSDGFAERLAHAVAGVRAHRVIDPDAAAARIEPDRVVRRSKHHALDAMAARSFEQIVGADDVRLQHRRPGRFDRNAAEMHDPIDAGDRLVERFGVGEIGLRRNARRCEGPRAA